MAVDPEGRLAFGDRGAIRRITDGIVETIAGTGIVGSSADGGPAIEADILGAGAMKYDAQGNLFFASASRIRKVSRDGVITTVAGTGIPGVLGSDGPARSAQIQQVNALAIDAAGFIYFTERNLDWIRRITPEGRIEIFAGRDNPACVQDGDGGGALSAGLCKPVYLVFDTKGNLYFSEARTIRKISPDGTVSRFAGFGSFGVDDGGSALQATFQDVRGLARDASDTIYVAESASGSTGVIRRIMNGTIARVAGSTSGSNSADGRGLDVRFFSPGSLAASSSGYVYFGDSGKIRRLTPNGMIETVAGGNPKSAPDGIKAKDAWLLNPTAVAVSRSGNVYLGEGCTVRKIGSDGALRIVAGTGTCSQAPPSAPAPAIQADMPEIASMAVDSEERIFFTYNLGSGVIQPDGTVTFEPSQVRMGSVVIDSKDRVYLYGQSSGLSRRLPGASKPEVLNWPGIERSPGLRTNNIAIDSDDNVYLAQVVDGGSFAGIYRFNAAGQGGLLFESTYSLRGNSGQNAQSWNGFAVDSAGRTWLMTWQGLGLVQGDATLKSLRLLGSGYSGDGTPLTSARFAIPPSTVLGTIAAAASGDTYVVDSGNGALRKITAPRAAKPVISQSGVVHALSLLGGPVAPGELISIFGSNLAPGGLEVAQVVDNAIPSGLAGVRVLFGRSPIHPEFPAAITAVSPTQINAFVPYSANSSDRIFVEVDGIRSEAAPIQLANVAFGLATANASGSGPGAILNQDGTINDSAHPAAKGSVIVLYGSGEGLTTPALPDGAIAISTPLAKPIATPLKVTIGGHSAEILYAGAAPLLPSGVLQINARVPIDLSAGEAAITVTLGSFTTSRVVTVSVR